eukprot:1791196-Amphidinium_carterae.1
MPDHEPHWPTSLVLCGCTMEEPEKIVDRLQYRPRMYDGISPAHAARAAHLSQAKHPAASPCSHIILLTSQLHHLANERSCEANGHRFL